MPVMIGVAVAFVLIAVYVVTSVTRLKESSAAMEQTARELLTRLQAMEAKMEETERKMGSDFAFMRTEQRDGLVALGNVQGARIKEIGDMQRQSLESMSRQFMDSSHASEEKLEAMRETMEKKLQELQKGNDEKLEKMRATVDEKLHDTLEKRLGEAFTNVSDRLEQVHRSLGEMKALSTDVGDLKKVLSNVKVRGTWGEMQLKSLLEQILTPDQYAENVATRPRHAERVEFAISLPGKGDGGCPVWMPIDSKFPMEDYQRLVAAAEAGDNQAIAEAQKALKARVLAEAKDIHNKYIEPPYTTDFGILYLPIEGLYAEVLRIEGLCDSLSREFRVVPAGPTTIAALLNSLQMGFRTLAIEKRSSEVWSLLGRVKTEFGKFGDVLEKTKAKIDQASRDLDSAGVRNRAITRVLKNVEALPGGDETGQNSLFTEE